MSLELELSVAVHAARVGGDVVLNHFRKGVTMRHKSSYNLVSDADVEAEQAIVAAIREKFPTHSFLGEEAHSGAIDAEHLWVIDPIDGTNNFAHRLPQFAVSVAYWRAGQGMCGVIYDPLRNDLYVATRGGGALHNGDRMRVSQETKLDQAMIGVGFYYDRGAMMEATLMAIRDLFYQQIHGIRRFGAATLDLCLVGQGSFGGFFEFELSPWDFAAGALIVEEAGGYVTTCQGEPLTLKKSSLLATNQVLHPAMLEIVRQHWPPQQKA